MWIEDIKHPRRRRETDPEMVRRYRFDSFGEYLERAGGPRHPNARHSSGWGTPEHKQELRKAAEGDPAMIQMAEEFRKALFDDISRCLPLPEATYDVTGQYWDLDRVMSGDPECWVDYQPAQDMDRAGRGNLVRFVINTAASAGCFQSSHTNRAGAILALVDILEVSGFLIQFEVATSLNTGSGLLEFRTIAKLPSQSASLAQFAYWTSSDMERHIDFAICETLPELNRQNGYTDYGWPYPVPDRGDICFDGMYLGDAGVDWNNKASVLAYCRKELTNLGVKFENTPQTTTGD